MESRTLLINWPNTTKDQELRARDGATVNMATRVLAAPFNFAKDQHPLNAFAFFCPRIYFLAREGDR